MIPFFLLKLVIAYSISNVPNFHPSMYNIVMAISGCLSGMNVPTLFYVNKIESLHRLKKFIVNLIG